MHISYDNWGMFFQPHLGPAEQQVFCLQKHLFSAGEFFTKLLDLLNATPYYSCISVLPTVFSNSLI